MNIQLAYLMGMIVGNGQIKRGKTNTSIQISIPHRTQYADATQDVQKAVKESISNMKKILQPIVGAPITDTQSKGETKLYFYNENDNYVISEIVRLCNGEDSCETMRIPEYFFKQASKDEVKSFLRGLADVTAHVRKSNYFISKENQQHRVFIEVPHNWFLVVDICNLLKKVDVPVQNIDWAHPNIRDGNLTKYNQGYPNFWKKEHQIKIFANEFKTIGFNSIHKKEGLDEMVQLLESTYMRQHGKPASTFTHKFYWEGQERLKEKPHHPGENDSFIPAEIRGKHFNSWKEIAKALGYYK